MLRAAQLARACTVAERFGVRLTQVGVDLAAVQTRARTVFDELSGEGTRPFEREGITVFEQEARLIGPHDVDLADGRTIRTGRVVLATRYRTRGPPDPHLAEGPFWTNHEAIWARTTVPTSLGVIGTGAIGLEFAQIYARFGAQVSVLEAADRPLPREDADAAKVAVKALIEDGIEVRAGVESVEPVHADGAWRLDAGGGASSSRSSSWRPGGAPSSTGMTSLPPG